MSEILIVDDDTMLLASLRGLLTRAGYAVVAVPSPAEAIDYVRAQRPDLVLMDMNFTRGTSGIEGITLLKQVKIFRPEVPVILMTAWGSIDLAVEGMRAGAFDFITKPWDNAVLLERISTALSLHRAPDADGVFDRGAIAGTSASIESILSAAARVAPTDAPVLITGESGTGKALLAETIHRNSRRAGRPFVKVKLGGMPPAMFESEMFGHVRGAFSGALTDRKGCFELADGGTLFLDEIDTLEAVSQMKLMRVLQEQSFEPLGSNRSRRLDVRVVCATSADLGAMVADRRFREDLFYRINLVTLHVPSLRERRSDIPAIVRAFARAYARNTPGAELAAFTDEAMAYLATLPFPGNIRELRNIVERAILMSGHRMISDDDLRAAAANVSPQAAPDTLEGLERRKIAEALSMAGGNVSRAAASLGISRGALYRRMEKYGLS